jgi:hypothetical protein
MKRLVFAILIPFLFSCDPNEEEQGKIYSFSGTVRVNQFDGSDPVPLPNAKIKIHFYTGITQPMVKLIDSAELTSDANGNFTLQKKLPENTYSAYSLEVDDPYYRDCTGITSSHNTIEYQGFSPESNYFNEILVCHTGNVKIVANKTSAGSNTSLSISHKATAGSTTVIDAGDVIFTNAETTYYFFSRVTEAEFTFKRYNGSTLTSEEKVPVDLTPGTTVELSVEF